MFIKTIFGDSKPVFLGIAKFADFRRKNVDVSRSQGVCYVTQAFFGYVRDVGFVRYPL